MPSDIDTNQMTADCRAPVGVQSSIINREFVRRLKKLHCSVNIPLTTRLYAARSFSHVLRNGVCFGMKIGGSRLFIFQLMMRESRSKHLIYNSPSTKERFLSWADVCSGERSLNATRTPSIGADALAVNLIF